MIFTAILVSLTVFCALFARVDMALLISLALVVGGAFAITGRHHHDGTMTVDIIAQKSRLGNVNPAVKFWSAISVIVLVILANDPWAGLMCTVLMLLLTVCVGGLPLHDYLHMIAVPVAFLTLGGIVILFEFGSEATGVLNVPLFGGYIYVTPKTQMTALTVMAKAMGAVSCLYALSLSTTVTEIIDVLRKAHCPDVIVELMYLIYRYIFLLLSMYRSMKDAAESRLGYVTKKRAMATTGSVFAGLLIRSYMRAGRNFDAMESRCFDRDIRFLEDRKPLMPSHAAVCAALAALTAVTAFAL